ncbi:restriction endonuclease [Streptomyces aureocirculatus]|uniref:restriction endonuclease n=1 Tax=Streptomyces aureocirculatus TaxID=67275 RepID=UPI00099C1E26|nr:restriction endonuclease [Streptomyces aureocirculatus]
MDRNRRFDLRTTALFFVLVAIALCGTVFLVRAAAHMAESNPLWIGSLVTVGVAATCLGRSRWRRFSAARCARRAAEVLEEAAERASESLDTTAVAGEAQAAPTIAWDGSAVADTQQTAPGTLAPVAPTPGAAVPGTTVPGTLVPDPSVAGAPVAEEATTVVLDTPVDYAELDADAFEQAIADLCVRDACQEVEVVGGACDLGADVLAFAPDGRRIVIQCKRYGEDNKVGSQDLQRFGGTCFTVHEADVAVLVTTSEFTAPALEYARHCGIVCVDGADLRAWCDGTGPNPWDLVAADPDESAITVRECPGTADHHRTADPGGAP